MATKKKNPARPLIGLAVAIVIGIVALTIGHFATGVSLTPKLALDLEGGTQLILTPRLQDGAEGRTISQEDMNEAVSIIRQRVDASGVAETEISTLGTDNIVVAIPGDADEEILNLVRSSATMRFRPVLQVGEPYGLDPSQLVQSGVQSGEEDSQANLSVEDAALAIADKDGDGELSNTPTGDPTDNSDPLWITEQVNHDFLLLDCTNPESMTQEVADDPEKPMAACDVNGQSKYILGPVDVEGTHIINATATPDYTATGQPTGQYAVSLELDGEGAKLFAESSTRLYGLKDTDPTRNRFAIVLDGNVIVAPSMNVPISDGKAQITGNFSAAEAQSLANQVQFGSLPLNFEVQSEQQISATLGSSHLEKGLWAGLIGLLLVVLYMVWQYRGLSLLSAGSLLLAAVITYLVVTLLSWWMGYRLSLPGVAGLIVAIGITADSFIVYFERIRDEVREGRPLVTAVDDGWDRAKRTILISDTVNLVAAIVLYVLAVGGVQGFAFTLGVTTLVDLLVVFAFTHPMLQLLIKTRFYGGGHKLSGLDPKSLGARASVSYKGRGRVDISGAKEPSDAADKKDRNREPVLVGAGVAAVAQSEDGPRLSLAERRRLARQQSEQANFDGIEAPAVTDNDSAEGEKEDTDA